MMTMTMMIRCLLCTSSHRKGRLGKEINDMRSRLVDLGLSYAQQQSKARRGRPAAAAAAAASGSAAGALQEEREALRKREEAAAKEAPGTINAPPVVMLRADSSEFCIGSPVAMAPKVRTPFEAASGASPSLLEKQEDEEGNIVKEAVGEIQQQQQQNGPGGARADHGAGTAPPSRRIERSRSGGRSSRTSLPSSSEHPLPLSNPPPSPPPPV